jgi:hypothetical protein
MISEQAKQGVNLIFTKAAKANLAVDSSDSIEIDLLRGTQVVETPEERIMVLTVVSYVFRLLVIFHMNRDKATEAYFTRSDPKREFDEVLGELGNLCCGAMNRELGNHFLHTGMSTPYMLESKCIPFLMELKPTYIAQHRIGINGAVFMHATLCLCAYAPIDFQVDAASTVEETGVLELF